MDWECLHLVIRMYNNNPNKRGDFMIIQIYIDGLNWLIWADPSVAYAFAEVDDCEF